MCIAKAYFSGRLFLIWQTTCFVMNMNKINVFFTFLAFAFALNLNAQTVNISTPDMLVQEGETFQMEVKVADFDLMIALQFAVFWDSDVIEFVGTGDYNLPGLDVNDNFNVMGSKMRFNWVDTDPTFSGYSLADGESLFTITFKAVGGPAMTSMVEIKGDEANPVFPVEFTAVSGVVPVNAESGKVTIDGVSASSETITSEFTLFQNSPNPFRTQTNISFQLNQTSQAKIKIYDHSGKTVFEKNALYTSGLHKIQVDRDLFQSAGSYFFTLKTENATATRQLIVQ